MLVNMTNKGEKDMRKVNVYELKTNLSKYLQMLEKGEEDEIVICRYDKKVAIISLCKEEKKKRVGCGVGILPKKEFELKKGFEDIPELFGY